jgi:hypothetical protein
LILHASIQIASLQQSSKIAALELLQMLMQLPNELGLNRVDTAMFPGATDMLPNDAVVSARIFMTAVAKSYSDSMLPFLLEESVRLFADVSLCDRNREVILLMLQPWLAHFGYCENFGKRSVNLSAKKVDGKYGSRLASAIVADASLPEGTSVSNLLLPAASAQTVGMPNMGEYCQQLVLQYLWHVCLAVFDTPLASACVPSTWLALIPSDVSRGAGMCFSACLV